jgi:hypothetical protein
MRFKPVFRMAEAAWTPGPWRACEGSLDENVWGWVRGGKYDCGLAPIGDDIYEGDAFANAHLMAAAPELYTALRILDQFASTGSLYRGSLLQKDVRAALAKAHGKTAPQSTEAA